MPGGGRRHFEEQRLLCCRGRRLGNAGRTLANPATMPNRRNPRLEKVITPILFVLARVGFVRFYYPDAMIGKFVVRSRQVELRHVAGHTIRFGDRTSLRARFWRCRFSRGRLCAAVAGQALGVEIHRRGSEVVVRIVARQAADARIVWVVAFAARQAIRLKADVGNARVSLHGYFRPGAVTLAAKLDACSAESPISLCKSLVAPALVIAGHASRPGARR